MFFCKWYLDSVAMKFIYKFQQKIEQIKFVTTQCNMPHGKVPWSTDNSAWK